MAVARSSKPFRDSKIHGTNMGPTWVLSAPDGPDVGHMNLAIRVTINMLTREVFYRDANFYMQLMHLNVP